MTIYELRTYTLYVGKLQEAIGHYQTLAMPALEKGGFDKKLIGYFISDTGVLNQLVHLWKFDDDADRRAFWSSLYADDDFMVFAGRIRPLIREQKNQLMVAAPWGSHP